MDKKTYQRKYPFFSQCGLNCGLCPRFHTDGASRCPGCGGSGFFEKRPSCGIISCSVRHGNLAHCYLCEEYPCQKYQKADLCDSFISHRNMKSDFARAKQIGIDAYYAELEQKMAILALLLASYNDGQKKSFYCLAVNLLALADLLSVIQQLADTTKSMQSIKEKAAFASSLLQQVAEQQGIELKLHKKAATK